MGTPASTSFLLAGLALLIYSFPSRRRITSAQGLAIAVCLIGLLGSIGFLYGAQQLYVIARVTGIAWPTAVSLLLLGLGLVCVRPDEGVMRVVTADDAGGRIMRWLLLPIVGVPLLIGYLRLVGERLGVYDAAMGTALVMLVFIIVFLFVVYHGAGDLSRREAAQRSVEQAQRQSDERMRLQVERMPLGCILFDDQFRFMQLNPAAERLFGYTAGELVGQPADLIVPDAVLPQIRDVMRRLADGDMAANSINENLTKAGRTILCQWTNTPLRDARGEFIGTLSMIEDVTERQRAQRERETTLDVLRLLNRCTCRRELVQAAVAFFRKECGFEAVGIRLRQGDDYPYFEASGFSNEFLRVENRLCERDADRNVLRDSQGDLMLECMCGSVLRGACAPGKPFFTAAGSFWVNSTRELLAVTTASDGSARRRDRCISEGYESVALIPLRAGTDLFGLLQINDRRAGLFTPEGIAFWERLANYFAVALAKLRTDDQLRKTIQELERSNRELEQFAYITTHDLQEPLRQVRSFVQLLRDRHQDKLEGKAGQYMQFIYDGAARMSDLVQALLAYSRVTASEADRRQADCEQALAVALANLQTSIKESGAKITHDSLPVMVADSMQLTQLFQNLIGNAIKFRREGAIPEIHVGCRRDGDSWILSVTDNGIGIAPEFHERIFVIFQRLHGREEYPGTGIGLAICRKIVDHHGGSIWVESESGRGSTFFVTLPDVSISPP
jgi:PAS domain S-box-containing protein